MITHTDALEAYNLIQTLSQTVESLKDEVTRLNEQIAWFKRQVFGQRSERYVPSNPDEMLLPSFEFPDQVIEKEPRKPSPKPHLKTKKDSCKLSFPDDLPIETTILDLSEKDKICAITGKALIKVGEDVTQRLAHKPGSYYIKKVIRIKYATSDEGEGTITSADLPDSLLTKCKADESFLADVLVKKFADHLPLYRQAEILSREGINITRQLLSQWVVKCGLALKPLFDVMSKCVLESENVFMDEVPVNMLKPGKGSVQQTYMWVMVGGNEANPAYRVYNFRTNRKHENAIELLKGYRGVLHSDKYGAYENLALKEDFTWCPCWSHIRRKFFEGEAGDPTFCKLIIKKIKYLFMLERVAWNQSEEERLRIRQEKEAPIIDEIISLIKKRLFEGPILPRSKFREALGYTYGLSKFLKNYTLHPFARIDNNIAERSVRPLAIGRKNWLFLGNEEGGEAAGIILSLVQTCRALKINPREYLEDVMRRLMSHSNQNLTDLLPDNWIKAKSKLT
jgi:transposase